MLVGTAPSRISVAARAYYANPGNRFWPTLHEVGLTDQLLLPQEYARLPDYGLGLTDVAKRHSGVDADLPAGAWAPDELRDKLRTFRPRLVAFTSKRGAAETLGVPTGRLPYGPHPDPLDDAEVWVLPSTSPLARSHFQLGPWQALGARVQALRGNPGGPGRVPES